MKFEFPREIASETDLALARKFGVQVEGRDGNFVLKGYRLGEKIYLYSFDEIDVDKSNKV